MSKTILITGCSSGFGKDTALLLARSGYTVYATLRDANGKNHEAASELLSIAAQESLELDVVELDVTNERSIKKAIDYIINLSSSIDVLINNAGYGIYGWSEGFETSTVRHLFDVNFFGTLDVNNAVLPHMRKRADGLIIHISSILARLPVGFMSAYNASKFAIDGYAESLNMELAELGLQSLIVQPGFFGTGFAQNMTYNDKPDTIAAYGVLATKPLQMLEGFAKILPMMPPSTLVAEGIKALIETPKMQRPLRTVISAEPHKHLVERLNDAGNQATKELNEIMMAYQQ